MCQHSYLSENTPHAISGYPKSLLPNYTHFLPRNKNLMAPNLQRQSPRGLWAMPRTGSVIPKSSVELFPF